MSEERPAERKVVDLQFWRDGRASPHGTPDDHGSGGGGPPPGGAPPASGGRAVWGSDDALALQLVNELGPDWRYVDKWAKWLWWDGVRWQFDDKLVILRRAREICRGVAQQIEGAGLARTISAGRTTMAVANLARNDARTATAHDVWDADPWLLNTPGGIVDLRTGEKHPHDRGRLMMHVAGANPEGGCPEWFRFLDHITGADHAYQDYLQRLVGYSLTGSTKEEMFAFLHGPPNTGKSKFVETLRLLHGTYGVGAPMDTFTATTAERHPTDLAGFVGKRLVSAAETEEGRRWDQQRLTTLTGRDEIQARFMRGDFFGYYPQFLLMFHGNYRPRLGTADAAMRRRMHLLPFRYKPARIDEDLIEKLRAQLGGILIWAIEGAVNWRNHGLKPPYIIKSATDKYFERENVFAVWLNERCVLGDNLTVTTRELYRDYRVWLKEGGENEKFALSERRFVETLEYQTGLTPNWRHPKTRNHGFRGIARRQGTDTLPL
jgi:putative DNA primase/helicase